MEEVAEREKECSDLKPMGISLAPATNEYEILMTDGCAAGSSPRSFVGDDDLDVSSHKYASATAFRSSNRARDNVPSRRTLHMSDGRDRISNSSKCFGYAAGMIRDAGKKETIRSAMVIRRITPVDG